MPDKHITSPKVSTIVVVGTQRVRAQQCITGLCQQENADQLEIVIVDQGLPHADKLHTSGQARNVGAVSEGIGYISLAGNANDGFVEVEIYAKRNHEIDI